jgi:hypothetical protein
VPRSAIDTEAGSGPSRALARVGVRVEALHLATTVVAGVWIPLAVGFPPPTRPTTGSPRSADLEELPEEARFVLGDSQYTTRPTYAHGLRREREVLGGERTGNLPIHRRGGGEQAHLS